jgi:hypothetical protein
MVTINETGREEPPKVLADDEEDVHDGWGPIRPRRSSMPPDHPETHEHERQREPNTTMSCRTEKKA